MPVTGSKSWHTYRLSIRVYTDGFSLYIYNVSDDRLIQREHYTATEPGELADMLKRSLARPRLMEYRYGQVELLACTPTTHLPLDEFRREEESALYRLTFTQLDVKETEVHHEILKDLEVVELFSVNGQVEATIRELYPQVEIRCLQGSILEQMAARCRKAQNKGITCCTHVRDRQMFLATFDQEGHLTFANDFMVNNDPDRLYYLLYTWKTLGLDTRNDACFLEEASDQLLGNVRKFILNVETCA